MSHNPSYHQSLLKDSQGELSPVNQLHRVEWVLGPKLPLLRRAGLLLAQHGDCRPFFQARKALELVLVGIHIPTPPGDLSEVAYVAETVSMWETVDAARQQYEKQLNLHPHAAELLWLLDEAIVERRRARHMLRRAGLDIRSGALRFLRAHCATTAATLVPYFVYRRYESILHAGLCAVCVAYQAGEDVPAIVQRGTLAMRLMWFDSLHWQIGMLMEVPIPEVQTVGMLAFSGWVRTQLTLKPLPPKGGNRLRAALEEESKIQGGSPEHILLERLPTNTYRAWKEKQWKTHAELRTQIAYLVEHDVTDQSHQEFPKEPSQGVLQPREDLTRDNPTYEEVARKLEEEDQYIAWVITEANLTPLEADVTRLKLQDPPIPEQEIADTLGHRSLGSVKQAWLRARPKLKRIINQ
jgi:hypothetical protein